MATFDEQDLEILNQVAVEITEFFYEMRKGYAQTKYVFEVKEDATWSDWGNEKVDVPVPQHLTGLWVMTHADDLRCQNLREAIKTQQWSKCVRKERTEVFYDPI